MGVNQPDLFSAPVRHTDPVTSKNAAASVNVTRGRRIVAEVMQVSKWATHEQLIDAVRACGHTLSDSGVRTRCRELLELGWVKPSGRFHKTKAGRSTVVWEWCGPESWRAAS